MSYRVRDLKTDLLVVGWTLLALSVALVNAGSGLTALWVLLACIGWTVFLLIPVKWGLRWLARNTGSSTSISYPRLGISRYSHIPSRKRAHRPIHDGDDLDSLWICVLHRCDWRPCHFRCGFLLLPYLRLISSSIPAGAFVAGIIVPREGGLAIALTEKLEDMVAIIFLPLVCSVPIIPASRAKIVLSNSTLRSLGFLPILDS